MRLLSKIFHPDAGRNTRSAVLILLREGTRLAGLAVLLEIAVSFFAPHYRRQIFDQEFTAGFPVAVDASGQRGVVVEKEKPEGVYRILVLGDSISFGTGVAAENAWPALLREKLERSGMEVECINAAAPGRGLRENLLEFESRWNQYNPDLILVAVSNNMIALSLIHKDLKAASSAADQRPASSQNSAASKTPDLKTQLKRLSKELGSPSWVSTQSQRLSYAMGLANHQMDRSVPRGPMLAYGYQQADLDPNMAEEGWKVFESDLEQIQVAAEGAGARLMVVTFPVRFQLSDSWIDNEKWVPKSRLVVDSEARFRQASQQLGVDVIESGQKFRERLSSQSATSPAAWYLHFDFAHFTPAGHDVIAQSIVDTLGDTKSPTKTNSLKGAGG